MWDVVQCSGAILRYSIKVVIDSVKLKRNERATGAIISSMAGDTARDQLAYDGAAALSSNYYVFLSRYDDFSGIVDGGGAITMNGAMGAQMTVTLLKRMPHCYFIDK